MRAVYTGHEALTFNDYLDLATGRTLHAEPGGTYDIAPAGGRDVPEVPGPWFTALTVPAGKKPVPAKAAEPAGEEPDTGKPAKF